MNLTLPVSGRKIPCQDILYYLKYECKDEGRDTGVTRIFCQHVIIENRNLKSVNSILNFTF